jgi:tetratricopeptide (TPR) repeat protein
MKRLTCLPLVAILFAASLEAADHQHGASAPSGGAVPLFTDLGTWTHKVTTVSTRAQKYFDQGLRLYYGFNHAEAIRAFREAAELDPKCAMAYWGIAIASGPNINMPMDAAGAATALKAIAKAKGLAPDMSDADRAYIDALDVRYSADTSSRAPLDTAYANAMRKLSKRYPDDPDAATLFAESMLDLNPWNQWTHEGEPNPGTLEAVAALEGVLAKHPEHPGANHFYIHAVEASPNPARASEAAKRLETLMPGAGHLVHMPSHIYARTGRYDDALKQNEKAVAIDEKYIATQKPEGPYPLMYYNHNIQFIWFSAMMEGRSAEAIQAARKIVSHIPAELLAQMPMLEVAAPMTIITQVRFGRWDDALNEPAPPTAARFATGLWHYGRGLAYAAKGVFDAATSELDSLQETASVIPADMMISINYAGPLLRLASNALAGEIAERKNQMPEAVRLFQVAVTQEDSLHYDEPPTWDYPVRHSLGVALLKAGRAQDAETVYRDDLKRHPENGWGLKGLALALKAQGRDAEAMAVEDRFRKAWARADVKLLTSEF